MGESMTVEGATDTEAFEAYVEHFVAPSLIQRAGGGARWAGGSPATEDKRELIEARGADLVFLPSYSPDLNPIEENPIEENPIEENPIEEAFSKIKVLVRKESARLREALVARR